MKCTPRFRRCQAWRRRRTAMKAPVATRPRASSSSGDADTPVLGRFRGTVAVTGVVAAVVVVAGAAPAHVELVMTFESNVTAPLRARRRPFTVAEVCAATEVRARTVPTKAELVPMVAELPICQKTLHAAAPLMRATLLDEAVMSVLAAWKMNTAFGSP